ncbi:trifunctional histidinol dehydrogenase [Hanseniaspora vineae]
MGLPFAPLYTTVQELEEQFPRFQYTANCVLDFSTLSVADILQFINVQGKYLQDVYVKNVTSKDDIVALLNGGVSKILVDESSADKIDIASISETDCSSRFVASSAIEELHLCNSEQLARKYMACLKTDRDDGLFTSVVVDANNKCLGLVYSNFDSLLAALQTGTGVYFSRSRNEIWYKGKTSGDTQKLLSVGFDCDGDCLKFVVEQSGSGFCHVPEQTTCFGSQNYDIYELEKIIQSRFQESNLPSNAKSYTKRLFSDSKLLSAKIREEADELVEAETKDEISWEFADLLYFSVCKLVQNGVSLKDVEANLKLKNLKTIKRKGDAKPKYLESEEATSTETKPVEEKQASEKPIHLSVVNYGDKQGIIDAFTRPIQKSNDIMNLVGPIVSNVRTKGDAALLEYTEKFDGCKLSSPVLEAPFPREYVESLSEEMKQSLDLSIANVEKFHQAQLQTDILDVETQPGVICSRFPRPIEKVGLYIPGGTAVLPSTALMLGVPAKVAQCKEIVFATPPNRQTGKISGEVVYVAEKVGCKKIVLAGGAQAVAAMAYGTESIPKVDKIMGPGNQFVTAAKMLVSNDTSALCSIDMPAGPSEVLVVCDKKSDYDFVASDLLSQAEHGIDSQVILVGVDLDEEYLNNLQNAVDKQANALPRVDIVRKCIEHSTIVLCKTVEEAFEMSNDYAPEHLILQIENAQSYLHLVDNAGSVFVGAYTPESCGDYSSGTNHTLPTYGYARQYSGVNTATFQKFITSQAITPQGLDKIGKAVMTIAKVEGLDGHRNAVKIRMQKLGLVPETFE